MNTVFVWGRQFTDHRAEHTKKTAQAIDTDWYCADHRSRPDPARVQWLCFWRQQLFAMLPHPTGAVLDEGFYEQNPDGLNVLALLVSHTTKNRAIAAAMPISIGPVVETPPTAGGGAVRWRPCGDSCGEGSSAAAAQAAAGTANIPPGSNVLRFPLLTASTPRER